MKSFNSALGTFTTDASNLTADLKSAVYQLAKPVFITNSNCAVRAANEGVATIGQVDDNPVHLIGYAPAMGPAQLGCPAFKKRYGLKYAYIMGAMANGITSADMVIEAAHNGCLGFFGAGGLNPKVVEENILKIKAAVGDKAFGGNLLNSPQAPEIEEAVVELYLRLGVSIISASAYMRLTLPLVYFRVKGIHKDADGNIVVPNHVVGKLSRAEVAKHFLSPPPAKIVTKLLEAGKITAEEADLAQYISMADDISAEADSGGHTDNRPALAMFTSIAALRDELSAKFGYKHRICVGLGGGIGTPEAAAAAFALGADYLLTGSINQACVEAGTSDYVKSMLAKIDQTEVTMAPAADMFELGAKVQVVRRGTMFSQKAQKLVEIMKKYDRVEDLDPKDKLFMEDQCFLRSLEEEWQSTEDFFKMRDPKQLDKVAENPKFKLTLLIRSYLGQSPRWAINDVATRRMDFQIWSGPAIGAFNQWTAGTFLAEPANRRVGIVAKNILTGCVIQMRLNMLMETGVKIPADWKFKPMTEEELNQITGV